MTPVRVPDMTPVRQKLTRWKKYICNVLKSNRGMDHFWETCNPCHARHIVQRGSLKLKISQCINQLLQEEDNGIFGFIEELCVRGELGVVNLLLDDGK